MSFKPGTWLPEPSQPPPPGLARAVLEAIVLALAFMLVGKLAQSLAIPPTINPGIYPQSGIALAAVLIRGYRIVPGVLAGSALLAVWILLDVSGTSLHTALAVAASTSVGLSLQVMVGAWLIQRTIGYPNELDRGRDVVLFMLLGALLPSLIGPSFGTLAMALQPEGQNMDLSSLWTSWVTSHALGTAIATPITLTWLGAPEAAWRKRRWTVGLPLLFAILAVFAGYFNAVHWEMKNQLFEFRLRSERVSKELQARLQSYDQLLLHLQRHVEAAPPNTGQSFERFSNGLTGHYPALHGLYWLQEVPAGHRTSFEAQRQQLQAGFRIIEPDATFKPVPAGVRDVYFPVLFAYPPPPLGTEPGMDLGYLPEQRTLLRTHPSTERTLVSAPLNIHGGDSATVLLVRQASSVQDDVRHQVVVALRTDELLKRVVSRDDMRLMMLALWDITPGTRPKLLTGHSGQATAYTQRQSILMGDRVYQLISEPSAQYWQRHRSWDSWIVVAGGLFIVSVFAGFLLMVTGRTNRVEAQIAARTRELDENRTRLQNILDYAADAIVTTNGDGQITSVNRTTCRLFGYSEAELIGQPLFVLLPTPDRHHPLRDVQTGATLQNKEATGLTASGQKIPLEIAASVSLLGGQAVYIGVLHDLSERKRIDRLKNEFVATVSHELRTPLTSIRGALGLVSAEVFGKLPEQSTDLLRIASDNADRLASLIDDLLDFESLEVGGMRFQIAACDVREVVEKTVRASQGYANRFQVQLEAPDLTGPRLVVFADHDRLGQVLNNLISNAIKFSPAQGKVSVRIQQNDEQRVAIQVIDQGPGIDPAFHDRIFQKFSQADASDTRRVAGTGLGLHLARQMTERMGGTIGYESEPGRGASFWISFPVASDPGEGPPDRQTAPA